MTKDTDIAVVSEMHDLLDKERAALLAGNLDEVGRLYESKQMLIERIESLDPIKAENLVAVQTKVTRNQQLLQSAMEGIRTVADRIGELRKVRQGFDTYDENGRRVTVGGRSKSRFEKRA